MISEERPSSPIIIPFDQIKISKYADKVPSLSEGEYNSLKQSIADHGLYEPITINPDGDVLDGHHRLKVCKELGIEPRFKIKASNDEVEEEIFVIDVNVARRQLNDYQRGELLLSKKKPILEKIAKENMSLGGKGVKDFTPLERVNEELAKQGDMSHMQLHKIETIMEKAPEELKEQVRKGKSINQAYQETQRLEDRNKPKPKPPEGRYDILYVDPPWSYDVGVMRGGPENHYSVMTNKEIMQMQIPSADNAVLFLWVPYPKTREAFDILDAWGFEFKSEFVWIKDKIGTGYYVRGKHEKLFICVKGVGLGVPAEQDRPESVVYAERTEHSKKPQVFYDIIERMYPGRSKIELFARGEAREGWKTWGLEAT
jgi:N6-adenosine-specific RNA methylase IME4/ParB-like chromosome segregation protein Spo0J